jgi:hypothetical protein
VISRLPQHGCLHALRARGGGGSFEVALWLVLKRFLFDKKMLKKKAFANLTSGRRQSKNFKQSQVRTRNRSSNKTCLFCGILRINSNCCPTIRHFSSTARLLHLNHFLKFTLSKSFRHV